ncbi:hypothetical protein IAT38_007066 [Cryptococcus sp. DSM 104549]
MSAPPPGSPNPVIAPQHVHDLLQRLHDRSVEQEKGVSIHGISPEEFDDYMRDKFIALDQDKCWFTYQLLLAQGARNVVEAGTSFGVSTIYLALAVAHNVALSGKPGTVIATEYEPSKAAQARANWKEAGKDVESVIDLREGDLLETLKVNIPEEGIDLLLLDIWAPLALPTLKTIEPHLKPGAVVLTDNSINSAARYKDLLGHLRDPKNGYTNVTVPYDKGLEFSVYTGAKA